MNRLFFSALCLLPLLTACGGASSPKATPAPPRQAVHVPWPVDQAPVPADWRLLPVTPGDWTYAQTAGGSAAHFGGTDQHAGFTVACDRTARRITLSRMAGAAAPVTLVLRSTEGDRSVMARPDAAAPHMLVAELSPADPLLDLMAFSRGHFAVENPGASPLKLPAWPEIAHVIEDCR